MAKVEMSEVYTLYDDASVRKKCRVMDKWEAMLDDSRNPTDDFTERVEDLLQFGRSYRVTIVIEEVVGDG